jgi:transposase-like protein
MSHRNAPLSELGRLRLARCVVEDGWPIARAAERFQVSRPTARRWAERYRQHGAAGMADRTSRPHHSPRRTPQPVVRKVVHLRWKQRLGPVAIAGRTGLAPSTVHRIPTSCRINRLRHIDRVTGEPIRRYEMSRPGELVHVDIKKLGNIPDGGGWNKLGRAQGHANTGSPRPVPAPQQTRSSEPWVLLRAQRDRRLQPARLHRSTRRRDRCDRTRLLGAGPRVLRRAPHHRRTRPHRQRQRLYQPCLA